MSYSQFHCIEYCLYLDMHGLVFVDKHMTTGRINQVAICPWKGTERKQI